MQPVEPKPGESPQTPKPQPRGPEIPEQPDPKPELPGPEIPERPEPKPALPIPESPAPDEPDPLQLPAHDTPVPAPKA